MKSRIELDSFDVKILQELQKNGGLSNQELAENIGLSASPCSRRVSHRLSSCNCESLNA